MKQHLSAGFSWKKGDIDRQLVKHYVSVFKSMSDRGRAALCMFSVKPDAAQLEHAKILAQILLWSIAMNKMWKITDMIAVKADKTSTFAFSYPKSTRTKTIAIPHLSTTSLI